MTIFTSPNLVVDGDMEDVGISHWDPAFAVVTKETPGHSGDQCLRVTANSGADGYAFQGPVEGGGICYFSSPKQVQYGGTVRAPKLFLDGWFRSDGIATPWVEIGNNDRFVLPVSTEWGRIQLLGNIAASSTYGKFWVSLGLTPSVGAGEYVEFDDFRIWQVAENCKNYSCWNCDKFQPVDVLTSRAGQCRGIPAAQCCSLGEQEETEPIWSGLNYIGTLYVGDSSAVWCAAWKRKNGTVAALPPIEQPPFER